MPDEPVFATPWHAHAFALVVALQDAGVLTATEWADALGAERAAPGTAWDGGDHADDWVVALGRLLAAKGVTTAEELDALTAAWARAAHATPHGQPIVLANDPRR